MQAQSAVSAQSMRPTAANSAVVSQMQQTAQILHCSLEIDQIRKSIMFIERLMNQTSAPVLEKMLAFTSARQELISENIANVDTPGYLHKDLDLKQFQASLQKYVEHRDLSGALPSAFGEPAMEEAHPIKGMLLHDGNNRSMESLQSDMAKNGLMHNMIVELLRKQYMQMEMALKEKVS